MALRWAEQARSLLDLAGRSHPRLATATDPLRSHFAVYRCYLHNVRGLANRLHGRYEEAVMDYWAAARLYRDIGAVNLEAMTLAHIIPIFPGVDPRWPVAGRTLPLAEADAALLRATRDERVHPQLRRAIAVSTALLRATYGDLRSAEELLRRGAAIPLGQRKQR
ncbi:hypothetical protein FDA94_00400 [Herbidospora galbida]|uniref:Tetratricopeptide repeat protein n=1 Tax=Herbidospora galbida TaxID=2575442 RepID=A0A4U3MP06_9ACTN|nr:hypothetical protein [Herbidospora galbida]TKK91311.1 hypothetical protein FDA94_00400 [Herbidospora galbida]